MRYGFGNLTFEMKDGALIEVFRAEDPTSDNTIRVTAPDGNTYVIVCGDVVRGFTGGNLTNSSGHPAPTFKLYVGYEYQGG